MSTHFNVNFHYTDCHNPNRSNIETLVYAARGYSGLKNKYQHIFYHKDRAWIFAENIFLEMEKKTSVVFFFRKGTLH